MSNSFYRRGADSKGAPMPPRLVDVIRENVVSRNADLERVCADGVDLLADALGCLQPAINGNATALCGDRDPGYFRDQLRGRRALTAEDICRLAIQAPAETVAFLRPILTAVAARAPQEMADALGEVIQVVDARLQNTREALGEVEARVNAWRAKR